ncbi:MAG: hypothetical protein ACNS62_07065 [Candidatus Cyclobacteriaceae bacterium M3_2C_046]
MNKNRTNNEHQFTLDAINQMTQTGNHPVVKNIVRQLILESIFFIAFLAVYYDFFDGHQKEMIWNILMILSVMLLLSHNLFGINLVNKVILADNLKDSIVKYLNLIKTYAKFSILTRVLAFAGIFLFFTDGKIDLITSSWAILLSILAILSLQIYWLNRIWQARINHIKNIDRFIDN